MKSMHIFQNYMREDFRRRLWTALLSAYLSLSCILDYALSLQGSRLFWGSEALGPSNPSWFFVSVLMAVLCAFQGFSYLFSETQCDFYFALPLKRRSLFLSGYLNGLLIGIVPCIIGRFTCMIIEGTFSASARYYTEMGILTGVIGFLLIYHAVLVILFLSGRILTAAAAAALAGAYGPITFGFVVQTYSSVFFETFYREEFMDSLAVYTSPYTLYQTFSGVLESSGTDDWSFSAHLPPLTAAVIILAFLAVLAGILFRKRPAESCGKVLAFSRVEFPVKLLLTLPLSLLCGCCLMKVSLAERSLPWLIIGIVFGTFTVHGLLETFFRFDIRGMTARKRQMLLISGLALLLAASFYFDWWKYDAYMPSPEQVTAVAVCPSGLDDASWQQESWFSGTIPLSDTTDSRLHTVRLTGGQKTAALRWLENLNENPEEDRQPIAFAAAAYILDNGRIHYRKYPIYDPETILSFNNIYETEEFKAGTIPLASYETTGRQHFIWSNGPETFHLNLTDEENEALLAAYKADLAELDLDTLQQEFPIGTLSLSYGNYGSVDSGFLYSGFTNTLNLLKQIGVPAEKTLAADYEIQELLVYKITPDSSGHSAPEKKKVLFCDITEDTEIQSLQPWLLYRSFAVNPILNPIDTEYEVTVLFRNSNGQTYDYTDAYLKIGSPVDTY